MARKFIPIGLCCLAVAQSFAADVVISEFMASNSRTLKDETGIYPDWIEIQNTTETNINLGGWYLTDAAGNLTKWRFPTTNINAGAFMVIYADSTDKSIAGAPLHTSFSLGADGEYLALVRPDRSIATEFRPQYLPQVSDISFGFGNLATNYSLVTATSTLRVKIPSSDVDGAAWTGVGFNDNSWTLGTNGVGYSATNVTSADYSKVVLPMQPVAYYRLNETSGTAAANLGSTATAGAYSGATLGAAGPRPPEFPGFEANNNAPTLNGSSSYVTANASLLSARSSFTIAGWMNSSSTPQARTGLFGQNDCVEFGWSAVGNLQCWTPNGNANLAWTIPNNVWVHVLAVCDGANLRLYTNGVQGTSSACTANTTSGSFFNIGGNGIFDTTGNFFPGTIDEVVVFHRALSATEITALYQGGLTAAGSPLLSSIKTDVGSAMSNVNASAYIRIPFTISDTNNVSLLTLRARYNDGFVAYVNGTPVAQVNAPEPVAYNSAATGRAEFASSEFRFAGTMLTNGANVLAIQGLNASANDTNFFFGADLLATSAALASTNPVYFTVPTPGAENNAGVTNPGPAIVEASHTPNVPNDNQEINVTTRVLRSFGAVSNVVVRYRVMFSNEVEIAMFDDGLHGDGGTNDGVFGATLPISTLSTNGEMIRWYFRATDVQGRVSRWPLFANPADGAEYLGTIVETNVASKLPVIHLFAPTSVLSPGPTTPQAGADSQTGGRIAVFYDGEFYDNVEFNLRGNSTAGFNKKSHRANFNTEHPFRSPWNRGRLRNTSFTADYPDPTYMRQGLSFWLTEALGVPSSFYDPVRLQLNTAFYQLANHNNPIGKELLGYLGYNQEGALYKAAGVVATSQYSTGGFEKKTRLTEPNTDYLTMAAAIAESNAVGTRKTNAFEMLDVPEMIEYIVAARWAHENDDVWANMTLYRDTLGDGLWRIIPFDMNLSWGAIFYEGSTPAVIEGVQATNDTHKGHPLYGSSSCVALSGPGAPNNFNRIYDIFFQVPELRQMVLRRMRSMLDTWVLPPGTPTNSTFVEQMILAKRDLIAEEANRDRAKWGWPAKGGQANFDPGINITNGVAAMLQQFFIARRYHFYGKHSVTNTSLAIGIGNANNAGIPLGQPSNAVINLLAFEYNPSSGNQGQEYIALTNPNPYALDISGWKLDGAVDFTFHPGTVMPSNSVIYVTPDLLAFRSRTATPRPGQGLFVVGNYKGQLSARGETIIIRDATDRIVSTNSYPGAPTLAQQFLRITEVMYHPVPPAAGSPYDQEDFEYIELKNIGTNALNLVGVHFTNGIEFTFTATNPVTSLAAGQSVVLVRNSAAFVSRYGAGITIAGTYGGSLDNAGERVQLHDAIGEEILDFTYNNSWYPVTDGLGFSLVIINESAPFNTWDQKESWRPSGRVNGSPGIVDPQPATVEPVLVNEVLAASVLPAVDFIELWNPSTNAAAVGGWFISDDFYTPKKYRVANGTTIPAGGYLVFTEAQFNPTPALATSFAFSSFGDEAYLFSADASGNLLGYYHGFHFGPSDAGVSLGRYINSRSKEHFVAQQSQTLGATNSGPRVGPIVISEVMYHPPDINGVDNTDDEFIELVNISGDSVSLYDTAAPTNGWKLKDAVSYQFPSNTVITAGASLLVVSFDPQTNAAALASFRNRYGLSSTVPIYGPYDGKLDNSANNVELAHPQPVTTNGFEYVLSDKVDYQDSGDWSSVADGFGASLHRIVNSGYGNDPTNWVAALPSPGAVYSSGVRPVITQQPHSRTNIAYQNASFDVQVTGAAPLYYQWLFNGSVLSGATNSILLLTNVQPQQAGSYSVLAWNAAGSVASEPATLAVMVPVTILEQPASVSVRIKPDPQAAAATNATFRVVATSSSPIRYQWRFNGNPIQGATSSTFTITNVATTDWGEYTVSLTDDLVTIVSDPAVLLPLIRAGFLVPPISQTIAAGSPVTVSVIATGWPPPYTFEWRRVSPAVNFVTNDQVEPVNFFTLIATNVPAVTSYRAILRNAALPNGVAVNFTLTTIADSDNDGVPDQWWTDNGLTAADANADTDNDGMLNWQEYVAGTNPRDSQSVLILQPLSAGDNTGAFSAASNKTYSVQFTDRLGSPWLSITNVGARTNNRIETFVRPPSTNGFYRVVTPRQ